MTALSTGTSLQNGKYIIKSAICQECLFISYKALQVSLNRSVIIREFFMRDFCSREENSSTIIINKEYSEEVNTFKTKFHADAKSNAKNEGEKEMKVVDIFDENNTSYYVFLGEEDIKTNNSVCVETASDSTYIVKENEDTEDVDSTIIEINASKAIDEVPVPATSNDSESKFTLRKNKQRAIIGSLIALVFGLLSIPAFLSEKPEPTEAEDEIDTLDMLCIDSCDYITDFPDTLYESTVEETQQEFERYIKLSEESLTKARNMPHRPSTIQHILDARYYYYDKANKINLALNGERLPANKEIDELTEQEFEYWLNEAKKCGSAKSKYELKRRYLKRAKSLAFKHQRTLDSQIQWLDKQLGKNR